MLDFDAILLIRYEHVVCFVNESCQIKSVSMYRFRTVSDSNSRYVRFSVKRCENSWRVVGPRRDFLARSDCGSAPPPPPIAGMPFYDEISK